MKNKLAFILSIFLTGTHLCGTENTNLLRFSSGPVVLLPVLSKGTSIPNVGQRYLSWGAKIALVTSAASLAIALTAFRVGFYIYKNDALYFASKNNQYYRVKFLIFFGADVNAKGCQDETLLHRAVRDRLAAEVVKKLIENGAKPNVINIHNQTPLHLAAVSGHKDVVQLLLAKGAKVKAKDNDGRTPLHLASLCGRKDIVQLLLEYKANVNARDLDKRTPLHNAAENGNKDVVQLLLKYGAGVNVTDKNGMTPLQLANRKGHVEIAKEIENYSRI